MRTQTPAPTSHVVPRLPAPPIVRPASYRDGARSREFGVGYGNSSGYASGKRYANDWGNARFQCG